MTINKDMTINKVIFISTRWIPEIPLFRDGNNNEKTPYEKYLVFSRVMTKYFLGNNDDCSNWIRLQASTFLPSSGPKVSDIVHDFIKKVEELGLSDHEISIPGQRKKQKLIDILKIDYDIIQYIKQRTAIINSRDILSQQLEQLKTVLPEINNTSSEELDVDSYDNQVILERPFENSKKDISHLDKPEGDKTVKHRLGIYKREANDLGLCVIWPWDGEYERYDVEEKNHDKEWEKAICKSIIEFYPNVEEAILLLHDRDFQKFQKEGKDEPLGQFTYEDNGKKIEYRVIVFRHTNADIQNIIQNTETITELYNATDEYINGYAGMQSADTENKNAEAHNKKLSKV